MRRFEFIEGSSSKFWEITVDGTKIETRWGRIGTEGQTKSATSGSPALATAAAQKQIGEKLAKGTALVRHEWAPEEEAFAECVLEVLPELHLPPHSSSYVGVSSGGLALGDDHAVYWDKVWLPWRSKQRPGDAGEAGIHQMLGYAVGDDTGDQGKDEEVLFGFDSDDRAKMEWGDAQCVWALMKRNDLAKRAWKKLRSAT